jgi:hypothetical protein
MELRSSGARGATHLWEPGQELWFLMIARVNKSTRASSTVLVSYLNGTGMGSPIRRTSTCRLTMSTAPRPSFEKSS